MDDKTRTNQALDKLAKMYLTNIGGDSDASSEDDIVVASDVHGGAKPSVMSSVDLKQSQAAGLIDQLEGPAPIRLRPKLESDSDSPPLKLHTLDNESSIDTPVASEFGDVGRECEGDQELAHHIEAVFMGHLPGFASPWLTQYAYYISQRRGPVGILHIDDRQVDVDLVGARLPAGSRLRPSNSYGSPLDDDMAAAGAYASDQASDDLIRQLDELANGVGGMSEPVRTWLIHLPEDSSGDQGSVFNSLSMARRLPNWTILSASNNAAVVAAYRMLRQMFIDNKNPAIAKDHRLGVMVLGSEEFKSRQAAEKLNHTAESFAEQGVDFVGWQKQMIPIVMQSLGSFVSSGDSLWPAVYSYLDDLSQRGGIEQLVVAPEGDVCEEAAAEEPAQEIEPVVKQPVEVEQVHAADIKAIEKPVEDMQAKEAPTKETPADDQRQTVASGELDLTEYVATGGDSLAARCPRDRHTQLMLDESGKLHLLHHHQQTMDLRTCLLQLTETSRWAQEHAELLQLTSPGKQIDIDDKPVVHVFTDEAKGAVQLIAGGPTVRFHLLQKVRVNGDSTWACTELN